MIQIVVRVAELVDDQYGNYLLQHLLQLNDHSISKTIHNTLKGRYRELSKHKFSSNVVEKTMLSGFSDIRSEVLGELICPDEMVDLLQDSYGNYVMQNALSLVEGDQALALIRVIYSCIDSLRKKIQKKWEKLLKTAAFRVTGSEDLDAIVAMSKKVSTPASSAWKQPQKRVKS